MKFTIRDLLWLTVVVALGVAWRVDHQNMASEIDGFFLERVQAHVIRVDEAQQLVHVSAGIDDGVHLGHTMEVSRGNQRLGRIVVQDLAPDGATAKIETKWGVIRKGDDVSFEFDRRRATWKSVMRAN